MTTGANIKELRLAKGMTQLQLATAVGLSKGYISLIESDDKVPRLVGLYAIAEVLKVSIKELIEE